MAGCVDYRPEKRSWSMSRDEEGHRTYTLTWLVRIPNARDGPSTASRNHYLPKPGSIWLEYTTWDIWAFCLPTMQVKPLVSKERGNYWLVTQTYSTKPGDRCQDQRIDDPLLEPQKVSGSFVRHSREMEFDKDGERIETSALELIRGPGVEFDDCLASVSIEQNVAVLGLGTITNLMNKVNDNALWGLAARRVKLSGCSWSRKVNGACDYYYTRSFDFDINFDGFDRQVANEGTQCVRGKWDKDVDPYVYVVDADIDVNRVRVRGDIDAYKMPSDTAGVTPLDFNGVPTTDEHNIKVEYYQEANFTTLGIPATL